MLDPDLFLLYINYLGAVLERFEVTGLYITVEQLRSCLQLDANCIKK